MRAGGKKIIPICSFHNYKLKLIKFQVTHDIRQYTVSKVFESVGKKTPIAVRFSQVAGNLGSADTVRDPRGKL